MLFNFLSTYQQPKKLVQIKVLKPGPDRIVRPGKPWTAHFCDSSSLKNRSMGKKQGPVWTAVGSHGLRTVIKSLLTVPCFHLNLKFKKKKKKTKNKTNKKTYERKRNTTVGSTSCLQKHCHCHLQRNIACLYVSSSSLFKVHHVAPFLQRLFSWANQTLNSSFVLCR